jgi:hypothetical protein
VARGAHGANWQSVQSIPSTGRAAFRSTVYGAAPEFSDNPETKNPRQSGWAAVFVPLRLSPACLLRVTILGMSDVTRLLEQLGQGNPSAAEELLPLVYDELRKLAKAILAQEKPGHTLDATALVHEVYLRLVGDQAFDGRYHFFAAAAEAMRRILVDHARSRQALKRGGVLYFSAGAFSSALHSSQPRTKTLTLG